VRRTLSSSDWIIVLGSILAGIGGIVSAWAALVRARGEGDEECERKLKAARLESEQIADELHEARMAKKAAG
jgi:gas vesicle protein